MFDYLSTLFSEPIAFFDQAIFRTLAVLIGLCCHEWGHAYVAYRCGDDTAKRAGRLTLNPLRHLDPVGTILMFFAGFGYAKPVPVNPYNFRGDRNRDDFLVSIAGITVNLNLAVFNLIPLPPLDGYHVVNDLIFKGRFQLSKNAFRIGMMIVLVLSAQGILGRIISWVVYPAQGLLLAPIRAIWG